MYPRLTSSLLIVVCAMAACTRGDSLEDIAEQELERSGPGGNDAALGRVRAAARCMANPDRNINYVAAEMEGVIKARTKSQALIYYDGYRVTFITPGGQVTQVTFDLVEAKPSLQQMTAAFGPASEVAKGWLYGQTSGSTGARIHILAEPVSMPAEGNGLVRRIIVRRARGR
ncbi:MAG: hypothetical protein HKN10_15595 [Myxococcales bacterium]|nr:hypothetical protein [Myxococcales bacterium]